MKNYIHNNKLHIFYHWRDIALGFFLALVFSYFSLKGSKFAPEELFQDNYRDEWFEGDTSRVYNNMVYRKSDHSRVKVHPIILLTTHPIVFFLKKMLHLESIIAVRIVIAGVAFLWMLAFFVLLRIMGCCRLDTLLFSLLLAVSAASVFWLTVPETFSFGSLSILLALIIALLAHKRKLSPFWFIWINVISLGFVVTNWVAGIFATIMSNRLKRAMHILVYSFFLVVLLWRVQKFIYPDITFFLGEHDDPWNWNLLGMKLSGMITVTLDAMVSILYHTLIMPAIQVVNDGVRLPRFVMITQSSPPGSASLWGLCAVFLWTILLILGVWKLFSLKKLFSFRIVLGLTLLSQLALHVVYGEETFLYSLHFVVLLLPLVALGSLTRLRIVVISMTCLLIPCAWINNTFQFSKALNFFKLYGVSSGVHPIDQKIYNIKL